MGLGVLTVTGADVADRQSADAIPGLAHAAGLLPPTRRQSIKSKNKKSTQIWVSVSDAGFPRPATNARHSVEPAHAAASCGQICAPSQGDVGLGVTAVGASVGAEVLGVGMSTAHMVQPPPKNTTSDDHVITAPVERTKLAAGVELDDPQNCWRLPPSTGLIPRKSSQPRVVTMLKRTVCGEHTIA